MLLLSEGAAYQHVGNWRANQNPRNPLINMGDGRSPLTENHRRVVVLGHSQCWLKPPSLEAAVHATLPLNDLVIFRDRLLELRGDVVPIEYIDAKREIGFLEGFFEVAEGIGV